MTNLKIKKRKDVIPGGLADKKQPVDFDPEALKKGLKVELEHTSDPDIAIEIAMDHLTEDPGYYDKLANIEKGKVKEMKLKIKKPLLKEELSTAATDFTGEQDLEGQMAKNELFKVHEYSKELIGMMSDEMQLPSWVQSKITKIADYIGAVKHFLEGEMSLKEADFPNNDYNEDEPPAVEIIADDLQDAISRRFPGYDKNREVEVSVHALTMEFAKKVHEIMGQPKINFDKERYNSKIKFEESYVFEGSCDDGDMYEMELYSEECGCGQLDKMEEAEYQGRKVPLNKPMRGDVKKFKVYVKDPSTGNVKKVNFGDKNMRIKKSNPARRKSFRARHNCKNPGPKTKARYWSCRKWEE